MTVGCGYANIPSLKELRNIQDNKSELTDQEMLRYNIHKHLGDSFYTRSGDDMPPLVQVEDTLSQWYKEDPTLFYATFDSGYDKKINITDYFLIQSKLSNKRDGDIAAILQKLGIEPTLPDNELDQISEMWSKDFNMGTKD